MKKDYRFLGLVVILGTGVTAVILLSPSKDIFANLNTQVVHRTSTKNVNVSLSVNTLPLPSNTPTNVNVSVNTNQKSNSTLNKNINKVVNTNTSKKKPTAPTNSKNANTSSNVNTNTGINAPSNVNVVEPSPTFIWPVSPRGGILFHFGDKIGNLVPWSGIDVLVDQGTPIISSAGGTVAIAKEPVVGSHAYISIIHGGGVVTLYGNISRVDVKVGQIVAQGQQVGLSGGTHGTPGAGPTSGPQLHFEIRLNGIPVDPLPYLPPI